MTINYLEIIKEALLLNNMTQKQLAEQLHLSPQTINSLIQGRTAMKLDDFFKISELLNLDPYFILDQKQDDSANNICLKAAIKNLNNNQKKIIVSMLQYFLYINTKKRP